MNEQKVNLSGKCTLQFRTGSSTCKIEIPKKSLKTGENNADELINQVLHFAIMRHGMNKLQEIVTEKFTHYDEKYKTWGIK